MNDVAEGARDFAGIARAYCEWVERGHSAEAREAMDHCLRLLLAAASLRRTDEIDGISEDGDAPTVVAPDGRFKKLPFQYYGVVFDPLQVPPEAPVIGDLADDLADIYVDLKSGLLLWGSGKRADAESH